MKRRYLWSLVAVVVAVAGILTLEPGGSSGWRILAPAHAGCRDWRKTVPQRRNRRGKLRYCAGCPGACGVNTRVRGPICARLALPAGGECAGAFGVYLNALTNNCKSKKFTDVFGLDGLTFGIRHNWTCNMPSVMQTFVDQDQALVERVFREGGVKQWLRGNRVVDSWFRKTQIAKKGLYCHLGFRRALQASTREPAFVVAQARHTYRKLKRFARQADRYYKSAYGKIAWAVISNNKGRCKKLDRLAEHCRSAGRELAQVECFIDRFVELGCRGGRDGSTRRARYIRNAFPTVASKTAVFKLEPIEQSVNRCLGKGAVALHPPEKPASAPPRPTSRPVPRATPAPGKHAGGTAAGREPAYCSAASWKRSRVATTGLGGARFGLKAFRLGRVVLAGMGVGRWTQAEGVGKVQAVARRLARRRAGTHSCTWYLHRRSRSPRAASTFRYRSVSTPDDPRTDPRKYERALGRAFGGGPGSFLRCARDHGYIGLGGAAMRDRGPTVFGMLLAFSGCSARSAVRVTERLWPTRVARAVRLAVAARGALLGRRRRRIRRQLARLFTARGSRPRVAAGTGRRGGS